MPEQRAHLTELDPKRETLLKMVCSHCGNRLDISRVIKSNETDETILHTIYLNVCECAADEFYKQGYVDGQRDDDA